jgi:hypothetical protein
VQGCHWQICDWSSGMQDTFGIFSAPYGGSIQERLATIGTWQTCQDASVLAYTALE